MNLEIQLCQSKIKIHMSRTSVEYIMKNWFLSKIHHKLNGDIQIGDKLWVYKPDLVIKIARETDTGWKVKCSNDPDENVYLLDWDHLDSYFKNDRKRIDQFLEKLST